MLALFLMSMMFLQNERPKTIDVNITSPDYLFEKGYLLLFSSDIIKTGPTTSTEEGGQEHAFVSAEIPQLGPVEFVDGKYSGANLGDAGGFVVVLSNVQAIRKRDGKHFQLAELVLRAAELSKADLGRGRWNIALNPLPLLRVRVLDKDGQSVPRKEVVIQLASLPITVSQVETNVDGEIFLLGHIGDYRTWIVQGDGLGFKIEVASQ